MAQQALPLVSIITAAYNREKTIGHAVDSVRRQTYPAIEHLIVDGASCDRTVEVARAVARPDVLIVSERDEGIYDALNKGVGRATGAVIGFVHSDDYLADEGVIAAVAEAFANPDIDAVYGDLDYVSGEGGERVVRRWRSGSFARSKLRQGWMPPHPALFLRRRVYERHGVFDVNFRIAADYDFILRVFSDDALRVRYLPQVMVKMRMGGASNKSLRKLIIKSREDWLAIRRNKIGGVGTLAIKNLSKLIQFMRIA